MSTPEVRSVLSPYRGQGAVEVSGSGISWVETYNPRNGSWARESAIAAAKRRHARAVRERDKDAARLAANKASSAWRRYELARRAYGWAWQRLYSSAEPDARRKRFKKVSPWLREREEAARKRLPYPTNCWMRDE